MAKIFPSDKQKWAAIPQEVKDLIQQEFKDEDVKPTLVSLTSYPGLAHWRVVLQTEFGRLAYYVTGTWTPEKGWAIEKKGEVSDEYP